MSSKRKRRSVHFCSVVQTHPSSSHDDMPPHHQRWMQPDERLAIRQACAACLTSSTDRVVQAYAYRKLYRGEALLETVHEFASSLDFDMLRGLEDRLVPTLAIERRMLRMRTIQGVVKAQQMNPEGLRALSCVLTHASRRLGVILAAVDTTAVALDRQNEQEEASEKDDDEEAITIQDNLDAPHLVAQEA